MTGCLRMEQGPLCLHEQTQPCLRFRFYTIYVYKGKIIAGVCSETIYEVQDSEPKATIRAQTLVFG